MHAILAYVMTYFRQAKNYAGQVEFINYLPVSSDIYVGACILSGILTYRTSSQG